MEIKTYKENKKDWDGFIEAHPDTWIDSTSRWLEFFVHQGYENLSFLVYRENKVVGVVPLSFVNSFLFGKRLVSGPLLDKGGPFVAESKALAVALSHIKSLADKKKVGFVELRGPPQKIPGYALRDDYVDFHLDLKTGVETLWKGMNKKLRNGIRRAQKDIQIRIGDTPEDLMILYRLYLKTMKVLGSPPLNFEFFETVGRDMAEKKAFIVFGLHKGKAVNANLVVLHKDHAKYELGTYDPRYREFQANSLLVWESIKECQKRRYSVFSFGRTLKESTVYTYKKRWPAVEKPSNYYYLMLNGKPVPSDIRGGVFTIAVAIWKWIPIPLAKHMGWIRKQLCM